MLPKRPDSASKTTKGRINEHFICRAAGLPVSQLDELRATQAVSAHDDCVRLQDQLSGQSAELSDTLFAAVDGESDQELRRALLNLKRDAHNGRRLRTKDLATVEGRVDNALLELLRRYRDDWLGLRDARRAAREIYDQELIRARKQFQQAVGHEDFAKGLLLSSLSLSDNVRRYQRASADKTGAKARQIERSLMRYFSRTVMKATPFSTFCSLLPGRLDREAKQAAFDLDPLGKTGHIRLNKTLYALMLPYLLGRPGIRSRLDVELNPTLQPEGQGLLFLAARGQQEIFQRMGHNPVVELLRERFQDRSRLPWQDLVDTLCAHPEVEASPEQAAAYVDKMIDIGLLRFRVGIPEQEADWDRPFVDRLSPIDDELARRVVAFLQELRQIADAYGQADAGSRRAPLNRAKSLVAELFQEIAPGRTEVKAPPFYEDAGAGGEEQSTALRLDLGDLEPALLDYVRLTSRLAWPRTEQANMRHFFDSFYGAEPGSLPLLKFYEDYYREHFKEHLRHQHGGPGVDHRGADGQGDESDEDGPQLDDKGEEGYSVFNPFGLQFLEDLDQGHKLITRRIQELWAESPEAEELELSKSDFESAVDHVPPLQAEPFSVSLFTQYLADYRADGAPALVARSYLTGFGKYFSRFLYLLPEGVQKDLLSDNQSMTDQELAEICGDANFNANLHPPLLPKELSYPTGEAGQEEHQILSSDVWVERDPASPFRLRLKRKSSGKAVVPVDLGFLNPRMRPHLFQLLSRFTPALSFNLPIPDTPTAMRDSELGDQVRYRPRITYEGKLILARRQWQLTEAQFPGLGPQETSADYFFRVQEWRRQLGLPQEVFMRIDVRPSPAAAEPKAGADSPEKRAKAGSPMRQHLYKPQYIDFHNPLLVDLFSRTRETLTYFQCTFEERLPGHGHLLPHGSDRFATEMIFQVDFPNGTAVAESSGASNP